MARSAVARRPWGPTAPAAATTSAPTKTTAPVKATAASKAIAAASAKVDAAGSAKVDGTFVTKGAGVALTVPFAGKERWSPSEAASVVVSGLKVAGTSVGRTTVLVTDKTVYLKLPSLASVLHKQWAKISLKGPTSVGGADLGQYANQAQQLQPGQYLRLLTTSVNVKAVGTATIDGVATKHYSGSVDLQKALAQLPNVPGDLDQARHQRGHQGGPHQRLARRQPASPQDHPGPGVFDGVADGQPAPQQLRGEGDRRPAGQGADPRPDQGSAQRRQLTRSPARARAVKA